MVERVDCLIEQQAPGFAFLGIVGHQQRIEQELKAVARRLVNLGGESWILAGIDARHHLWRQIPGLFALTDRSAPFDLRIKVMMQRRGH